MPKSTKHKATKNRSSEWQVGQPLAFPKNEAFERAARQAVDEGLRGPFQLKRGKKKKK